MEKAKYNFKETIKTRLYSAFRILMHKTFVVYTTDDIGGDWCLTNNVADLNEFADFIKNTICKVSHKLNTSNTLREGIINCWGSQSIAKLKKSLLFISRWKMTKSGFVQKLCFLRQLFVMEKQFNVLKK